uniref:Transmembrane protein n=1 Tax=Ascaris lumbricoides TaxID=6252 RepID=A0A0M3ID35_ASCLU
MKEEATKFSVLCVEPMKESENGTSMARQRIVTGKVWRKEQRKSETQKGKKTVGVNKRTFVNPSFGPFIEVRLGLFMHLPVRICGMSTLLFVMRNCFC